MRLSFYWKPVVLTPVRRVYRLLSELRGLENNNPVTVTQCCRRTFSVVSNYRQTNRQTKENGKWSHVMGLGCVTLFWFEILWRAFPHLYEIIKRRRTPPTHIGQSHKHRAKSCWWPSFLRMTVRIQNTGVFSLFLSLISSALWVTKVSVDPLSLYTVGSGQCHWNNYRHFYWVLQLIDACKNYLYSDYVKVLSIWCHLK